MAGEQSTWAGAVQFMGFAIHVKAYTTVQSRKTESLTMLDPVHKQPVRQQYVDVEGVVVPKDQTLRGVKVGRAVHLLSEEGTARIERATKTASCDVERFSPTESVRTELALQTLRIVPDERVDGSESPVQTLWNGLRATGRSAIVEDWCPRAGAYPSILAISAVEDGLVAHVLPYAHEVKRTLPSFAPVVDAEAAELFELVIAQRYETALFDHDAYQDTYAIRRQAAIDAALAGEASSLDGETPTSGAPDLMAVLRASVAEAKVRSAQEATPARPRRARKPATPKVKVAA